MNRVVGAVSFIVCHVQPCKERAHLGFDFKGDTDGTWERMERLTKEAVLRRAAELFAPNMPFSVPGQSKAFNCTNPPPQVKISTIVPGAFYSVPTRSNGLICLWKDPLAGTSDVLLGRAEERLAKSSGCQADHSAGGRCRQRLVGVRSPTCWSNRESPRCRIRSRGKGRRQMSREEENGRCISLGGDQTTRTRSATMSEWSNDDGTPVAPPPSTEAPSRNTRTEVQSKGGEGVP